VSSARGMTTSRRCYTSCTGFRFRSGWISSLGHLGLPFVVRHGSGLPGRWLSAVIWRRSSSAAFCRLKDLCRQADLQQLWGHMFRGCRPKSVVTAFRLLLGKRTLATNSLSGC